MNILQKIFANFLFIGVIFFEVSAYADNSSSKIYQPDSIEELKHKAEQGSVEAQYRLGEKYSGLTWFAFTSDTPNFNEAAKWFEKAAESDHLESQYSLGLLYFLGRIEGIDIEPIKWLHKAAEKNKEEAQILLGHLYYEGRGINKDYTKARKLFIAAMEHDEYLYDEAGGDAIIYPYIVLAVIRLSDIYFNGHGAVRDTSEALRWISQLRSNQYFSEKSHNDIYQFYRQIEAFVTEKAKNGNRKAQEQLAKMYYNFIYSDFDFGDANNSLNAEKWNKVLALKGDIEAQRRLVQIYCERLDKRNEGLYWHRKIAKRGNAEDQLIAGKAFAGSECSFGNSDGIKADYKEAEKWLTEASLKKHPEAQSELCFLYHMLGFLYSRGKDRGNEVKRDIPQAIKWYLKAAELGDEGANYELKRIYLELGSFYNEGKGVKRDIPQAIKWYEKAAELGDVGAQYELGGIYLYYWHENNIELSLKYYQMAADKGYELAKQAIENIYKNMGRK